MCGRFSIRRADTRTIVEGLSSAMRRTRWGLASDTEPSVVRYAESSQRVARAIGHV